MSLNHWKLLSECRFQPDLCHDFSQGILALMNVVWDNVRSLSDIEAGTHRKVGNVLGDEVETHVNVLRTGVQGNAVQILCHRVSLQEGWKMVNVTAIPEKVPRSEELQTVTLKSVLSKLETLASNCSGYVLRATWAMKTVAEAITEALVTSLEALGRQRPCPTTSTTPGFRPEQDFYLQHTAEEPVRGGRPQKQGRYQATEGDEDTRMLSSSAAVSGLFTPRCCSWVDVLALCGKVLVGGGGGGTGYRGGFCEKLLEASPVSNRANTSRL
ncbi:uncharacterized protein [Haliaeetus albicilla]|uniref:uncharacterized protein isoform X3 n=1 Tax=Haliaeetus albicilla TaxID=8969 RepID=UPI0037E8C746